ncbi:MAG: ABC-F type ribosomal protection protein [Clostridia bacterium]|nr:ABC-F type ribosomal protection protein [Clostridia bacterium]
MTALSVSAVSFKVGVKDILENISFAVEDGDRVGIVGVNGSGKSTLLRIITGKLAPTDGKVYIAKDRTVGMMEQDDAFNVAAFEGVDGSVLSQMYASRPDICRDETRLAELEELLKRAEGDDLHRLTSEFSEVNARFIDNGGLHYKSRCRSILQKLGFPENTFEAEVSSLSGGERERLNIARLLFSEPDILILDEPTNHLDTDTMEWLEGVLSNYKKTLLVVSHDRYFLDRVTTKTLDVEHHAAKLYGAPYTGYLKLKEEYRKAEQKKYDLQQKEIARLEAYIEQQRRWNRERNIIAAESREKAIARMEKVERPKDAPKSIRFGFTKSQESGNDVLSVRSLSMAYPSKVLFRDISFEVKKRERVFIAGANGTGKSTLLKILLEKISATSGVFEYGYNVTIGYYDQENQNLDPTKTVIDELWDAYPDRNQTELRNTLALFMFRGDDAFKSVSVLSGGERARLTLAKLILSKMNLLVLDEPTNHLDIGSREALESALESFDGTLIAVSHDRYFMRKLATRIIELKDGGIVLYPSYADYERARERAKEGVKAAEDESFESDSGLLTNKELYLLRKKEAAEARQYEKRRREVAEEIERLERELAEISDELYGDAATDYQRAAELDDRKTYVEDRLMSLYEEEEKF